MNLMTVLIFWKDANGGYSGSAPEDADTYAICFELYFMGSRLNITNVDVSYRTRLNL